jgi:uncharacterized protein YicC (UPF0701 family)
MAKRKTPKIKDLGPKKITDNQLTKLQGLVKAINETQAEVGMIETRKHNLLHQLFEMQAHLSDLQKEFKEQSVGQEVYGGHTICDIVEEKEKYSIYIKKNKDVMPWKDFNKNMAVSIEYNLEY